MNMLSSIPEEKINGLPAILSIREVAEIFLVTKQTIRHQILLKRLPAWKDEEGIWCIARSDLKKFFTVNTNL